MLKIFLLTGILLLLAIAGISIKLLFDRKSEFRAGSCASSSPELGKKGISCGCGGGHCENNS